MRILLPLLLLVAVGATFLILRRDPAETPGGTGPGATAAAAGTTQAPLDLARGEAPGSARAVALEPASDSNLPGSQGATAAQIAAENGLLPAVPEPTLDGGVAVAPVGSSATSPLDDALALKYLNWSRAERVQALETLRTTLEMQRTSPDKSVQVGLEALKHEMGWLESNLDG